MSAGRGQKGMSSFGGGALARGAGLPRRPFEQQTFAVSAPMSASFSHEPHVAHSGTEYHWLPQFPQCDVSLKALPHRSQERLSWRPHASQNESVESRQMRGPS